MIHDPAAMEPLESRRMLAFNTSFLDGVLRIVAAAGTTPVNIRVSVSLNNFRITDSNDGTSTDIPAASVGAISLVGAGGNDRLRIDGNIVRNATINGGAGNDTLFGGGGRDVFVGGSGIDMVDYSRYSSKLVLSIDGMANDGPGGTVDVDNIGLDVENISGGSNNDIITGSDAANVLMGNGGKDELRGGRGNDTLSGGNGNDFLDGGEGADILVGSAGVDLVTYAGVVDDLSITLDGIANDGKANEKDNIAGSVERFILGEGNDLFIGSGRSQEVDGGGGNDTLRGGGGGDTLRGGAGRDLLMGEGGNDVIFARDGEIDTVIGGSGSDIADTDGQDVVSSVP